MSLPKNTEYSSVDWQFCDAWLDYRKEKISAYEFLEILQELYAVSYELNYKDLNARISSAIDDLCESNDYLVNYKPKSSKEFEVSKPPLYFTLWSPMSFDDLKTIIAMFNMTETELIDAWYSLDIIPSIIAVCLYISIYIIGGSAIGYFALMFVDKIDSQIIQHFQK
jgi:hypothetical protein